MSKSITMQQLTGPTGTTFSYVAACLGHGLALELGIFVAGGLSGGHLNPVLSASFAIFRKFKWVHMLGYALMQILASLCAEFLVYVMFFSKLNVLTKLDFAAKSVVSAAANTGVQLAVTNGTLSVSSSTGLGYGTSVNSTIGNTLFMNLGSKGTFTNTLFEVANIKSNYTIIANSIPLNRTLVTAVTAGNSTSSRYNSTIGGAIGMAARAAASTAQPELDITGTISSLFLSELVGTLFLMIGIFAITDIKNSTSRRSAPLNIGLLYFGCKLVFGIPSHGSFFNPAIELSSRLLSLIFFKGSGLLHPIYMLATVIGPFIGGILGAVFYETFTWSDKEYRIKAGDK
ncbi:putative membrane protein [Smittium mucronatum]|uniref:Putative membrane protein n=1 Tax=Smittium mucronatum TaxID=133383 RepID=A0A1R0H3T8_9FUNG|nr:putative membrane protein [Smittium mucronatum]